MVVKIHHGSLAKLVRVPMHVETFRLPKQCFQRSRFEKDSIDIVKVGEVRVNLQDPVRLYKYYGSNVEQRHSAGEEWFILEPCNDIM